jgi:hypothetical protein
MIYGYYRLKPLILYEVPSYLCSDSELLTKIIRVNSSKYFSIRGPMVKLPVLHYIIRYFEEPLPFIKYLVEDKKFDINHPYRNYYDDYKAITPLAYARNCSTDSELIKYMVEHGALDNI